INVIHYTVSGARAHQLQAWDGRDALMGVIELFNHIDGLRKTLRPEAKVQGIITEGGKAPNVVPDRAVAEFWIRYPDPVYLAQVTERVNDAARGSGRATVTNVRIDVYSSSRNGISVAALNDVAFAYMKRLGATKVEEEAGRPLPYEETGTVATQIPGVGLTAHSSNGGYHTFEMEADALGEVGHHGFMVDAQTMAAVLYHFATDAPYRATVKREFDGLHGLYDECLTAGPRDGAPRWSRDGKTLAFVRPKDSHPQLYVLSLAGGEAQQLTDLPKGASAAAWSPDGKTIAFTSSTTPDDLEKKKKEKTDEPKSDVRVIVQAEYRADDEGWVDPTEHSHIWTVAAAVPGSGEQPAEAHQVTTGTFDENAPQWSPDGARIYFVSDRVVESYYYPPDNNFYSVPAAGGALDTAANIDGPIFGPVLSPDGNAVAFRGWINPRAARSYNQSDLFVSRGRTAKNLTADYD